MVVRPRFLLLKEIVGYCICHRVVGGTLSLLYRNRIPSNGCVFQTNNAAVSSRDKASLFWGMYESAEYRFIRDYLYPDTNVVEIGSGIGVISSHIARKLTAGRKLVSVEANPNLLELLKRNAQQNAPQTEIEVLHGALSYVAGETVEFTWGESHLVSRAGTGLATVSKVPALTLERIVKPRNFGTFQLVTDIEGAEAELFANEAAALQNCTQVISELHDTTLNGKQIKVNDIVESATKGCGFKVHDRYSNVFVFRK